MAYAVRLLLLLGALAWLNSVHALDRSQCKQYGGTVNCWMPVIGAWKHTLCGEVGSGPNSVPYQVAECQAQGGTWGGTQVGCQGLPAPEYRRPTSEADMRPLAEEIFAGWHSPLCEGPVSQSFSWGGVFSSVNCFNGNGPGYTYGYESSNTATPFAVTGKRLQSGVCSATDTVLGFKGSRLRPVSCTSVKQGEDFYPTSGGTPGLCNLGIRQPIDPKQPCEDCVGNPIVPISGVKRQIEVDYAGSGPQPLRFERVYNSRVYTRDGKQWRHNYSAHIENHDFGTVPVAVAHRASGRVFLFTLSGGQYLPDTDIDDRVTRLTDDGGALTGWQYLDAGSDSTELYDAQGNLLSIANRAGLTQTLEYSTAATPPAIAPGPGYLIRVTDAFGRQLNFTHDAFGRLATLQDPAGQTYLYESTTQNHFASVTYPDGKKRTYLYNEAAFLAGNSYDGRLTGLIDENEVRFGSYFYDFFAMATRSTHPDGVDNTVVNAGSWPSSINVTDARGTLRTYGYQSVNGAYRNTFIRQPAVSGTGTVQSTMSYDANGNMATRVDFNGNRTNYASYDLTRNLELSRTEGLTSAGAVTPATRTIDTEWHPTFRLPTRITEKNSAGAVLRETTMSHDAAGNVLSRTITAGANSRSWSYTYNANGSVETANGPRTDVADVTSYSYYVNDDPEAGKRGNVASITNAAGHVTSITAYNAHAQPLAIVDPNGLVTTLTYDARLRLASRTVGNEITSYEYDRVGQLAKVTLPDGSFLAYSYDAARRLTDITDALGNNIHYALDAMGNRTQEQVLDPLGTLAQTRSRVFNSLNRLSQEIGAQNQTTQYAYDNQGNVTSIDGPLAGTADVTGNQYDALNRLVRVTDPNSGQVNYGYNALDQLTSVTDPRSLVTSYGYNGLGDLNEQVSPDTGTTSNTYDSAGNLATTTDAKEQVTSYAYDALNRVSTVTFHDGSRQTYAYDQGMNGLGRLSSITETDSGNQAISAITYAYDPHGRVTSQTRTVGGISYVSAHSYDSAGRMSGMTYPSGRTVTYEFDALGRVSQVSTTKNSGTRVVVQNVTYHPFGGVTGYTLGNGQLYSRSVDRDGRISSYTLGSQSFGIGYDAASRIEFISELGNPTNSNTYGYDALDRLTSATTPGTPFSYSYDAVGNRSTKTAGAGTFTYAYSANSNRLASITPSSGPIRSFSFDPNGSTVADGVNTYAYDVRGRMVQAVSSLGTTTYQVNALGQRNRKTNTLGDTIFHYDMSGRLIAESSPAGAVKRELIYLGDIPVAVAQ